MVLEQDICGGGPSGRNGGFVNSFWEDLPHLADAFGDAMALRICRVGEQSVAAVGAFCDEHGIDGWFRADGGLGVATSETQVGAWGDQVIIADRLGVGADLDVLDATAARERLDSPVVFGGGLHAERRDRPAGEARRVACAGSRWNAASASTRVRR